MKTSCLTTSVVRFQIPYCINKNSEQCSLFLVYMTQLLKKSFLVTLLLICSACNENLNNLNKVTFTGPIMGTQYRIIVRLRDDQLVEADNIENELVTAMQNVNDSMSTYIPASELNQLNLSLIHI